MHLFPERLTEKIGFETVRSVTIDGTRSPMGMERLERMVPATDPAVIRRHLEQTREMMHLLRNDAAFPLDNLHDLRQHLKKGGAEGSMLGPEALLEILQQTSTASKVKKFIQSREQEFPKLKKISVGLVPQEDLEKIIKKAISEQGELRDDASPALKSIRTRLNKKRSDLRNTINKIMAKAAKAGMASDEGPTIRNGRMVIPIQAEYKRKIQGFIHDVSATGQTVYMEPAEALNINNEIRQLESEEQREIERILRELTGEVRQRRKYLKQNNEVLGELDAVAAKATVGIRLEGFIPVLSENRHLYLCEAYNPILLLKNNSLKPEEQEPVIPLTLELDEKEQCLVITGPNAGGKSVAMKTLGLCTLMVQCGYAIPAKDSSELPVFSGLFVDMGDDQSIENDLSTFSSRLNWMKLTHRLADSDSLVLIDEAAAGTDPEAGGALFQAFIGMMMARGAKVIVTTHHGSLKVFAYNHPHAVNGSMEFDQATLSPTYRFKKGVPGSSYAFEIAQRMNVNPELLDKARILLGEAKGTMEDLITELELRTQQAEELKKKYNTLKSDTEAARHKYEEKRSAIEKEKQQIREKALKEAKQIMLTANQKIEEAVQKIVEQDKKDKQTIGEARKQVEKYRSHIEGELDDLEERKKDRLSDDPPALGDTVRLADANTNAELVEINGSQAVVLSGGLRLKTNYRNLIKVEAPSGKKNKQNRVKVNVAGRSRRRSVKPSLHLRGMRGDEAVKELTRYLDDAVAAGLQRLEIIHGKGEGILKQLVHDHLSQRKEVKFFDLAPADRGGAGCTIVELE